MRRERATRDRPAHTHGGREQKYAEDTIKTAQFTPAA
jgi:hypothetical protein